MERTHHAFMRPAWKFGRFTASMVSLWLFWPAVAQGAFIGAYELTDWSLINTNANGMVTTLDGGNSIILTGPNNGNGLPGTTDLLILAPIAATVVFDWSYSSLDTAGSDSAGYLTAGQFFSLADASGLSGSVAFSVTTGEQFGFGVDSSDNTGEPGILTVSGFNANPVTAPEPGKSLTLLLLSVTLLVWIAGRQRKNEGKYNPRRPSEGTEPCWARTSNCVDQPAPQGRCGR